MKLDSSLRLSLLLALGIAAYSCTSEQAPPPSPKAPTAPSTNTCSKLFGQAQLCCPAQHFSKMPEKLSADPVSGFKLETWCEKDGKKSYPSFVWPDKFVFECPAGSVPAVARWSEEGTGGVEVACSIDGKNQGPYLRFWPSGPRFQAGTYAANGEMEGEMTRWHETGRVAGQGQHTANQRQGVWQFFDEEGNKIREDEYVGGKRHGRAKAWWKNGQPRYEMDLHEDEIHGQWVEFWFNGNKKQECPRVMGVSQGLYTSWWENGQMAARGQRRGKLGCGVWECWTANATPSSCWSSSEQPGEAYEGCKSSATGANCAKCKD